LEREIRDQFAREGQSGEARLRRFVYLKYRLQVRALPVELSAAGLAAETSESLADRFERQYADLYGEGAGYRQAGIELVKVRVDGLLDAVTPTLAADDAAPTRDASAALRGERDAYFVETRRYVATRIYDGDALRYGHSIAGPSIVERMGDTIVIPPGGAAEVDRYRNLILHVDRPAGERETVGRGAVTR